MLVEPAFQKVVIELELELALVNVNPVAAGDIIVTQEPQPIPTADDAIVPEGITAWPKLEPTMVDTTTPEGITMNPEPLPAVTDVDPVTLAGTAMKLEPAQTAVGAAPAAMKVFEVFNIEQAVTVEKPVAVLEQEFVHEAEVMSLGTTNGTNADMLGPIPARLSQYPYSPHTFWVSSFAVRSASCALRDGESQCSL